MNLVDYLKIHIHTNARYFQSYPKKLLGLLVNFVCSVLDGCSILKSFLTIDLLHEIWGYQSSKYC